MHALSLSLQVAATLLFIHLPSATPNRICAALFTGPNCDIPVDTIPECVGSTFRGPDFTLSRDLGQGFRNSPWVAGAGASRLLTDADIQSLPEFNFLGGSFSPSNPVRSCAVVSNSPSLLNSKFGKQIDTHDLVLRFNNAVTKGFEQDVGTKTTLRFTNSVYEGFRERDSEAVISQFCTSPPCSIKKLQRYNKKKVHALHPAFSHYIDNGWFRKRMHIPTSGYQGILLLMHVCAQVHVYGFDMDAAKPDGAQSNYELKTWYYSKRGPDGLRGKAKLAQKTWIVGRWSYACKGPDKSTAGFPCIQSYQDFAWNMPSPPPAPAAEPPPEPTVQVSFGDDGGKRHKREKRGRRLLGKQPGVVVAAVTRAAPANKTGWEQWNRADPKDKSTWKQSWTILHEKQCLAELLGDGTRGLVAPVPGMQIAPKTKPPKKLKGRKG